MGRSISQIQAAIWSLVTADAVLGPELTSTSTAATWWLWTWVVATVQWTQEDLFDRFVAEVKRIIATMKPHTLQWYVTMAKKFQLGDALVADEDYYDPIVPAHQIVTFGAAVEFSSLVRLKVAKGAVGSLSALSGGELTAFRAYMFRVKAAGVRLQCTSGAADNLQVAVTVYYDALILDATGARLDGTAGTPVKDAINVFLDSLPFNGVFSFVSFLDALRAVEGVKEPDVTVCQANYGLTAYVNIIAAGPQVYNPDAGYMALDVAYFNAHVSYLPL